LLSTGCKGGLLQSILYGAAICSSASETLLEEREIGIGADR